MRVVHKLTMLCTAKTNMAVLILAMQFINWSIKVPKNKVEMLHMTSYENFLEFKIHFIKTQEKSIKWVF